MRWADAVREHLRWRSKLRKWLARLRRRCVRQFCRRRCRRSKRAAPAADSVTIARYDSTTTYHSSRITTRTQLLVPLRPLRYMSFPFLLGHYAGRRLRWPSLKDKFITFMTAAVEECDFFFLPSVRLIEHCQRSPMEVSTWN